MQLTQFINCYRQTSIRGDLFVALGMAISTILEGLDELFAFRQLPVARNVSERAAKAVPRK